MLEVTRFKDIVRHNERLRVTRLSDRPKHYEHQRADDGQERRAEDVADEDDEGLTRGSVCICLLCVGSLGE